MPFGACTRRPAVDPKEHSSGVMVGRGEVLPLLNLTQCWLQALALDHSLGLATPLRPVDTLLARVYQKTVVSDHWDFNKGKETAVVPVLPPVGFCCEAFRASADPEVWTVCFLQA